MNMFNSVLPKSMSRFVFGLSFLGLVFAGSAHANAPVPGESYISSGGTLLVLKYEQNLGAAPVPVETDFTVTVLNDVADVLVSAVHVFGKTAVFVLDTPIRAVGDERKPVSVSLTNDGDAIEGPFSVDVDDNNSTNFPLSFSLKGPEGSVQCGAGEIVMEEDSINIYSTYCEDSTPLNTTGTGLVFYLDGQTPSAYCGSIDSISMEMNSSGHVSITTTDDCVKDRDEDGIPGVNDAAPDGKAGDACDEQGWGEVNLAFGNPGDCFGVVSVVTGKDVTISSNTEYTAGEFIRLGPTFRVEGPAQFTAGAGEF